MTRMRYLLNGVIALALLLLSQNLLAQREAEWFNGRITLDDDKVIEGEVQYNFVDDIVKIKGSEGERLLTAIKVKTFTILVDSAELMYYSLPNNLTGPNMVFYKVVFENSIGAILFRHLSEVNEYNTAFGFNVQGAAGFVPFVHRNTKVNRVVSIANKNGIFPILEKKVQNTIGYDYIKSKSNFGRSVKNEAESKEVSKYKKYFDLNIDRIFGSKGSDVQSLFEQEKMSIKSIDSWFSILNYLEEKNQ